MKRAVVGVVAIFASIGLLFGVKAGRGQGKPGNLVQNPSAEAGAGGMPSEWEKAVLPASMSLDGVDYLWHAKVAHTGKRSLCFKKTAERFFPVAQWTQTVPYTSNARQVKVSVWIKTRDAKKATLALTCRSGSGDNLSREFVAQVNDNGAPVTQDWKRYDATVTVPTGTKEIVIAPEMYGPGVAWFDDISIVPAT